MRELTRRGVTIPDQVAVMGFDALIEGDAVTTTRIPTQLVIRDSCGPQGRQT
ncbi:hypothetical protein [Asticcacaulis sp.]|uniref:hypothetical protein n=1 Tax=Asticcacaulis sp. TaxID=1872648 RepID=UPI002BB97788|nr:hypothetical protein [Asticcacaulis sp.]HTM81637.1 hypothetical protein [Asticcacaulis sp.]